MTVEIVFGRVVKNRPCVGTGVVVVVVVGLSLWVTGWWDDWVFVLIVVQGYRMNTVSGVRSGENRSCLVVLLAIC